MTPPLLPLHVAERQARRQMVLRDDDRRRMEGLARDYGDAWQRLRGFQVGKVPQQLPRSISAEDIARSLARKACWKDAVKDYLLDCFGSGSGRLTRLSVRPDDFARLELKALATGAQAASASAALGPRTKALCALLARGPLAPLLGARLLGGADAPALREAARAMAAQLVVCRGGLLHVPGVDLPVGLFVPRLRELVMLGQPWRDSGPSPYLALPCPHDAAISFRDVELLALLEGDEPIALDCDCSRFVLAMDAVVFYQQVTLDMLNLQNARSRRRERLEQLLGVLVRLLAHETPLHRRELCGYAFVLVEHSPERWTEDEMWAFYDAVEPLLGDIGRRQLQGWCLCHALAAKHAHPLAKLTARGCDFATLRCEPAHNGVAGGTIGDTAVHHVCRTLDEERALPLLEELLRLGAPAHAVQRDYDCDLIERGDVFEEPVAIAAGRGMARVVALLVAQPRCVDSLAATWRERGQSAERALAALGDLDDLELCDERLVGLVAALARWLLMDAALLDEPCMRVALQTLVFGQILLLRELDHYSFVVKPSLARHLPLQLPLDKDPNFAARPPRAKLERFVRDVRALLPKLLAMGEARVITDNLKADRAVISVESFMFEMSSRLRLWCLPRLTQLWLTGGAAAVQLLLAADKNISPHERSTLAALLLEHKSRPGRARRSSHALTAADAALFAHLTAPKNIAAQPQVVSRLIVAGVAFGAGAWLESWCDELLGHGVSLWATSIVPQRLCLRIAVESQPKLLGWLLRHVEPRALAAECLASDEAGDTLVHQLVRLAGPHCAQVCASLDAETLAEVCTQENLSGVTPPYEALAQGRPELFELLLGGLSAEQTWASCDAERLLVALEQKPGTSLRPLLERCEEQPLLRASLEPLLVPLARRLVEQGAALELAALRADFAQMPWSQEARVAGAARHATQAEEARGFQIQEGSDDKQRLPPELHRALMAAFGATSAAGCEAALECVADCLAREPLAGATEQTRAAAQRQVWQLLRRVDCWQNPGMGAHFAAHEPRKSLAALRARAQRLSRQGAFRFGQDDAIALLLARRRALAAAHEAHRKGLLRWASFVHTEQLEDTPGGDGYVLKDGALSYFTAALSVRFVFAARRGAPWILSAYPTDVGARPSVDGQARCNKILQEPPH